MLINSVILILREVLEAAVLVSLLLVLSLNLRLGIRWLLWSLPLAAIGTLLYAKQLGVITDMLDGAGQEITNASLQGLVYLFCLVLVACSVLVRTRSQIRSVMVILIGAAVCCAMIREAAEIFIYISGFTSVDEYRGAVIVGGAIGAGIGLSLGVLLFFGLRALSERHSYVLTVVLIVFIAAGMVMQATMLMQQVDWLATDRTLWDSSFILSEQSIAGELLYAVFGYESSPSATQIELYIGSLLLMLTTYTAAHLVSRRGDQYASEI